MSAPGKAPSRRWLRLDWPIVVVKELVQMSNRRQFHVENTAIGLLMTGTLWVMLAGLASLSGIQPRRLATAARELFMVFSVSSAIVLCLITLVVSTGIIQVERTGKRLDLLRITSLSLPGIILGKSAAVLARSGLVLLLSMPVMAAMQMLGGVSAGDVSKAVVMIVADITICAGIGVWVSAGARTGAERVFRAVYALVLWTLLSGIVPAVVFLAGAALAATAGMPGGYYPLYVFKGLGMSASVPMAASPWVAWALFVNALLSWQGVAINAAVQFLGAFLFVARSRRSLAKSIKKSEELREEFRVKSLFQLKRPESIKELSKKGRAGIRAVVSRWRGTLVGTQMLQSNLVATLLPAAVAIGFFASYVLLRLTSRSYFLAQDAASMSSLFLCLIVLAALGLESCCMIAREKHRQTAAILATTPAGGPEMLVWKGAGLFLSQGVGLLAMLFFFLAAAAGMGITPVRGFAVLAGYMATLLLLYGLGVSFSLCVSTPAAAVLWTLFTMFLLAPMFGTAMAVAPMALLRFFTPYSNRYSGAGGEAYVLLRGVCVSAGCILGIALCAFRNRFRGGAAVVLALGAALVLSTMGTSRAIAFAQLLEELGGHRRTFDTADSWKSLGYAAAMAAALLGGACLRFRSQFVRGAGSGGRR